MFSKLFVALVCVSSVFATPLAVRRDISNNVARRDVSPINARSSNQSFNRWRGFEALAGFDDFNGIDDFGGSRRDQVVVIQEEILVCQAVDVRIIQQQLVILQEFAKQIITQQICEVEVQTIILSQFEFGIRDFGRDVRRESNRQIGFDQDIAALLALLLNQDGSINVNDYGFDGNKVGDKTVVVEGNNWDDAKSPEAVKAAREAAEAAAQQEEEDAAAQDDQANDEAAQDDEAAADQAAADEAAKAEQEAADQAAADEAAKAEQAAAEQAAAEEAAQAEAPAAEEAAPVERRFRSMRRSSRK